MQAFKKPLMWVRIACVAVTLSAVWLVLHRLNFNALALAFKTMRRGWFFAAFCLYGLLFLPAAWRWHLVLRMTGTAVHPAATARVSLIGHFFYTMLFGGVAGDTAKAASYARWYNFPLPDILASAPLDRLLGFVGLLLLSALVTVAGFVAGAFVGLGPVSLNSPGRWALLVVITLVVAGLLLYRSKPESLYRRFSQALARGGRLLVASPCVALSGALCGLLVQLALNGVLAMNLQAVSLVAVPWTHILWTFPIIALISGLPITFAGLGTREGAALVLLAFMEFLRLKP